MARLLHEARLRLLALYAALVAVGWIVHALPGEPDYPETGAYAFWIAVDVVLFVLIARGSRFATGFAIALNVIPGLAILLVGADGGSVPVGTLAFAAVVAAQTIALAALWRRARPLPLAAG